jgi:mannose-6-phosphate isomerase-like protein (cupin superfamily)
MLPRVVRPAEAAEYPTPEGCSILESWNDPADPEASIARARVVPGAATRPHRLKGVVERYLIVAGQGSVQVGDAASQAVGPGDVVVIPAGVSQRIANTGPADLVFYCICTPRFTPGCYEALD